MSILMVSLFACSIKEEAMSIIVPQGSPTLSVLGLDEDYYYINIVNGPDPLVAAFGSGSHDAIIAPTNLGAKFYQSSDEYLLLGVIGLGNYHLVSQSFTDESFDQLSDQEIIVFGQNQTSDIIVRHLLEETGINATLSYVDSVASATATFLLDPSKIVLVAEPSLSLIKAQIPNLITIDLNEVYQSYHEGLDFPQASLFVRKNTSDERKERLINDIMASVAFLHNEKDEAAQKGVDKGILSEIDILSQAIDGSHISFILSMDAKPMIEVYFNLILAMNPNLIGGYIPNDDFYME